MKLWLIDAGYMFNAQSSVERGFFFDYRKVREVLEKDGVIDRAFYLNSTPNPPKDAQTSFNNWLQIARPQGPQLQVKLYGLKKMGFTCPECKKVSSKEVQKGVDVGLATLALTLLDRYDTLILSSGDGDFRDALDHVCNQSGKRLELAVFRSGVSAYLQSLSSKIYWLDDYKEEIKRTDDKAPTPTLTA